jgi:hypothetical protein
MRGKPLKTLGCSLVLLTSLAAPAIAGVDLAGSDIGDPADPIASPKTHADIIGTGPVANVVGESPLDRRVPLIVQPERPAESPSADVPINLD